MQVQHDHIDSVLSRLDRVEERGADQWLALCPAHDDRSPSLSVGIGSEGQVLLHCFTGCDPERIVGAIGLTMPELWPDYEPGDLTPEERRLRRIEIEQARQRRAIKRLQREAEETKRRLSALEQMANSRDPETYHEALFHNEEALEYWFGEGIYGDSIRYFQLGYCNACPMDYRRLPEGGYEFVGRPSYTIPMTAGGVYVNLRHRIKGAEGGDKYRPHLKGLPQALFNVDEIWKGSPNLAIWEGEKKTIVLRQALQGPEWSHVGISGAEVWEAEWSEWIKQANFRSVFVAFDPGVEALAYKLAATLRRAGIPKGRVRVANFPVKPDDWIVRDHAGLGAIESTLRTARPM